MNASTANAFLFSLGLALAALGHMHAERLPDPAEVLEEMLPEPVQIQGNRAPFKAQAGGIEYTVRPRYRYVLTGVVVSRHDTSA